MERDEPDIPGRPIGRRIFLGLAGAGLTSLAWGGDVLKGASSVVPQAVRDAIPASGPWRIYAVNPPYPRFDAATWELSIEGAVEKPVTLTIEQLRALAPVTQVADFHCVTGWSVTDVQWGGVRFADLLALARPTAAARAVSFVSAEEPYFDTLTLEQLKEPDAMLAYDMDGKPLKREHGAPTRVVMPKMYGYKGVKWVQRLVVTEDIPVGYWEERGYDNDAWVGRSNGI